jgi:hypothetical protein
MIWLTEIRVKENDKEFVWAGPDIEADSFNEALEWLYKNGLSGIQIIGESKDEIELPCQN